MSRMKALIGWVLFWMLVISLVSAFPVQAQDPTPENDANCVSCHEHRYYLYDTGKWYCLCEAPMHCVYCHGGRTDSHKEEIAHEGLVLYPTREQAARCQACHTEDYMARVVKFDSIAGLSATPITMITATPVDSGMIAVIEPPDITTGVINQFETWRLASLGVLGVVFLGIIFFAARCYQHDCMRRQS